MTQALAPFGFRPVYHPSGLDRAKRYQIASGYPTAMYKGQMVTLNTNGTVQTAAAAADFLGVLVGVEFIDGNGKPNLQPNWPAGQVTQNAQNAFAWVLDDPEIIFEAQANGSVPQAAIGDQTDVVSVSAGNTMTGLSTSGVAATLAGAAAQGQWRIRGFSLAQDNLAGDPFTVLQLQIARSQFYPAKVAV